MISRVDEIIMNHLLPSENYIYGFADLTGLLDVKFEGYECADFGRLKLGVDVRICGICVAACPVGRSKALNNHPNHV